MLTDPISDLLTRIRNASCVSHETVKVPHSKVKEKIVEVLVEEGFVAEYNTYKIPGTVKKEMEITLKYGPGEKPVIRGLKRISRPGLRTYVSTKKIPRVLNGLGIAILSTSKGIMSGEASRRENLGGEYLCSVW